MNNILITGYPRIGKTTALKNLVEKLSCSLAGFVTEEIKDNSGRRTGFKVKGLMNDEEAVLASVGIRSTYRVGKYGVDLSSFEEVAISEMSNTKAKIIIIDEIGKMELFSKKFKTLLLDLLDRKKVVGSITKRGGGDFVQKIKKREDVLVIEVTKTNRDDLPQELFRLITER
jgi:nucleoside-triphosphatase THEP1